MFGNPCDALQLDLFHQPLKLWFTVRLELNNWFPQGSRRQTSRIDRRSLALPAPSEKTGQFSRDGEKG